MLILLELCFDLHGFARQMKFSFRWLFIAFILDLFSLFLFADAFGALWTLAWVLGAIVLGLYFIMSAGDTLQSLGGLMTSPQERIEAIRETPWTIIAAIFFMIPGLFSDLFAIILLIPDARRALFSLLRKKTPAPKSTDGTVYEAQYEDANAQSPHHSASETPHTPHRPILLEGQWEEKK